MEGGDRTRERLVALAVLGAVLLLPPVLLVLNRPGRVLGVPALYLYIFAAWALIIALTAAVAARIAKSEEPEQPQRPTDREDGADETRPRNA